jgi:hypothetical protein
MCMTIAHTGAFVKNACGSKHPLEWLGAVLGKRVAAWLLRDPGVIHGPGNGTLRQQGDATNHVGHREEKPLAMPLG